MIFCFRVSAVLFDAPGIYMCHNTLVIVATDPVTLSINGTENPTHDIKQNAIFKTVIMRTKQITKCFELTQTLRARSKPLN